MIVEDDAIINKEMEFGLKSIGYNAVESAQTGLEAIKKARKCRPGIILMDINLKGEMDGIEAADIIRSCFDIPVIFLTAYVDEEKLERAKLTLPFGYLLKPVQEPDLKVAIEIALHTSKVETERKKAQDELAKQKSELQTIFDSVPAMVFYKDKNDRFLNANKGFAEFLGLSKEEIIGETASNLSPVKNKSYFEDDLQVIESGEPKLGIIEPFQTSGGARWAQTDKIPYRNDEDEIIGTIGFSKDITDRKKAEEALRQSETKYRNLYDNAPDMYLSVDAKTANIIDCNQMFIKTLGYTRAEIVGSSVFDHYTPESAAYAKKKVFPELVETEKIEGEELQVQRKDGSIIDVSLSVSAVRDPNGMVLYSNSSWRDISDKKRLEKAREKTEQVIRIERDKVQSVLNAIGEGLYIVNDDHVVEYQNEIFKTQYGDSIGQKCHLKIFDSEEPCEFCPLTENPRMAELQNIETFLPDGRNFDIVFSPYTNINGDTKTIVLLFDITEKKSLQAEAMRAGHLASLGELSAGVAHEINNPVNGIVSLTEVMKDQLADRNQDTGIPDRIIKEAVRISTIVNGLLSFARDRKEEHSLVGLPDILGDALNLMERQLRKDGITLSTEIPIDLPKIKARSQEIQQVFLNVISNARYALNQKYPDFSEDKRLAITVETVDLENGPFVRTKFHDTGTGIPKNILEKIKTPFFSTKPAGEGTGLGLSISHGIVATHQGNLSFKSAKGDYTEVVIDLPVNNGWTL